MAAGDLVTDDYHLELRGRLMGPGTPFHWDGPWGGFGFAAVKTADVELDQAAGVVAGRDYLAARVLTFPIGFGGGDSAAAMVLFRQLLQAWAPSKATDLEIWGQLPGWGRFQALGRPRGLVEDLASLKSGEGRALATFQVSDAEILLVDEPGS